MSEDYQEVVKKGAFKLLGFVVAFIGLLASIIGVFQFFTGIENFQMLSRTPTLPSQSIAPPLSQPKVTSTLTNTPLPPKKTPTPTEAIPTEIEGRLRSVCSNAPKTRLAIGMKAVVTTYPDRSNNVRSDPGMSGQFKFLIRPNQTITIIDGPECADGFVWWKIRTADDRVGWTAEGDDQFYWINPKD